MKYTTAIAAVALAMGANAAQSPLIPSGLSSGCNTFLESLNADTNIQTCIKPLVDATATFSPTSGKTPSDADVNAALSKICGKDTGCDDGAVRSQLSQFSSACAADLRSNKQLLELYDILYVFTPLHDAVCSVNSANQEYCVNQIRSATKNAASTPAAAAGSASAVPSGLANAKVNLVVAPTTLDSVIDQATEFLTSSFQSVKKRVFTPRAAAPANAKNLASIVTPNATTYQSTNLPFLFLQPEMAKDSLCTACTISVFASYVKWENSLPYGLGLSSSPILGGQAKLYNAVNQTCGKSFVDAISSQAGADSSVLSAAMPRAAAPTVAALVAGALAYVLV